jgi:N-acetylmuramoyl-L-alanine amidase
MSRRRESLLPPTEPLLRVGIIAGHWQYDSGAICDDGLQEVEITLPVARMVVNELNARGYEAELLGEYSDRLRGYKALALVSIHADSCLPELSGYKTVGRGWGPPADASSQLADCLTRHYGAASGLIFHESTITPDMTNYHAFQEIAPQTPAAIVELGFMGGDRELLTTRRSMLAQGIVEGLLEFLGPRTQTQQTPSPRP